MPLSKKGGEGEPPLLTTDPCVTLLEAISKLVPSNPGIAYELLHFYLEVCPKLGRRGE